MKINVVNLMPQTPFGIGVVQNLGKLELQQFPKKAGEIIQIGTVKLLAAKNLFPSLGGDLWTLYLQEGDPTSLSEFEANVEEPKII